MSETDSGVSFSPDVLERTRTGAAYGSAVMHSSYHTAGARAQWQRHIDDRLLSWLGDPDQLADEGVTPPTGRIIRLAIDIAEKYRDEGYPAPTAVVPDPNGGIVFRRREETISEVIHIWDNGDVEYQLFDGTQLIERGPLF